MLDQSTRAAILKLKQQGHSIRGIARALRVSRGAVRDVLRSGTEIVPTLVREEKAAPYRDQILELYQCCKGNLVRVHEELVASGAQFSYPALTAFCRRQGIGQEPKEPVGSITLVRLKRCSMTPHHTVPRSVANCGPFRLLRWSAAIRACCSSNFS
jgi:transposase